MKVEKFYREDGTLFYEEYDTWYCGKEYKLKHKFIPKLLICDKNGNPIV